nr:magnesium transporter [Mobilicoccus sp.]
MSPEQARVLAEGDPTQLATTLPTLSVPEIRGAFGRLPAARRAVVFRLLDKKTALDVFEGLDTATAGELIAHLRAESVSRLVADLDPDDRARLLDELPASLVVTLLSGLDAHEREMTETVLGFPRESAGRRMTPEVAAVPESATVGEALQTLRHAGADVETIYMVPVLGPGRRLVGVVSLRELVTAERDERVIDLSSRPVSVNVHEDQEVAAGLIRDHGMVGLPVVDDEERLVGVITVDDAMRILAEEAEEDAARASGTQVVRRPYLATPIRHLVRSRVVWLLVLIAAATLTVNVLDYFESTLEQVVALALFVPLLIGTGGNAGAQTVTTVVRSLSAGEISVRDAPRVALRELGTGLSLGVVLAVVGFVPAWLLVDAQIATVLCLSLIAVCALATTVGAVIPILASKAGVDPAVVSAPFITTVVDATGLITYFLIARRARVVMGESVTGSPSAGSRGSRSGSSRSTPRAGLRRVRRGRPPTWGRRPPGRCGRARRVTRHRRRCRR